MTMHPSSRHRSDVRRARRTQRHLGLPAGVGLLLLGLAVAACNPHVVHPPPPPPAPGPTTVAEGPEPNGNEVGATPTAFTAPFPVRLTGTQDPDNGVDAFTTTAPGPGTLTTSCSDAVNVRIGDESEQTATQGGCGLDHHTDGGAVSFWIIAYEPGEPYAVTVTFVPD